MIDPVISETPIDVDALRATCGPVLAAVPGGAMIVFDQDRRVLLAEGEGFDRAGIRPEDLLGRRLPDVLPSESWAKLREAYDGALQGRRTVFEFGARGTLFSIHVSPVVTSAGGRAGLAVSHEITEQRRLETVLSEQQDGARASEELLRSAFDHAPIGMSVVTPNGEWLRVNDEYCRLLGYDRTDLLGTTFQFLTHPDDLDDDREFLAAVVAGTQDRLDREKRYLRRDGSTAWVHVRSEVIRDDTGQALYIVSHLLDITDSRAADAARVERVECSELIRCALAEDRMVLHGQPIMNLGSLEIEQTELLVRMRASIGRPELIAPGKFLPAAERFGMIHLIDERVIAQAIECAAAGRRVEVNVSAKTISDPSLVAQIERRLAASGAPPENLVFEITETAVAGNLDAASLFASRLRDLGCAFALDDFGVGHGTFTYLRHLAVDYLKIDMQFVRDLLFDTADRSVVEAIIGVASHFNIQTIAEGVEDQATLDELRGMGVDYAQGYLLGRPISLDELWKPQASNRSSR